MMILGPHFFSVGFGPFKFHDKWGGNKESGEKPENKASPATE